VAVGRAADVGGRRKADDRTNERKRNEKKRETTPVQATFISLKTSSTGGCRKREKRGKV